MTTPTPKQYPPTDSIQIERNFLRFSLAQRWEHAVILISISVLLLTGLPQKYQNAGWSQWLISSPERLTQIQQIHHIFALLLCAGALYHLGHGIFLLIRRRLSDEIFPQWEDFRNAWKMLKFLLFITREKPKDGKFNFEQKLTYWFVFFGVGILISSGLILWFPLAITRILPGGVVPAAFLAHSNEAIALAIFIIIWHFYHVHFQRLNLSIFTGRIAESEMQEYHCSEYERLMSKELIDAESQGEDS